MSSSGSPVLAICLLLAAVAAFILAIELVSAAESRRAAKRMYDRVGRADASFRASDAAANRSASDVVGKRSGTAAGKRSGTTVGKRSGMAAGKRSGKTSVKAGGINKSISKILGLLPGISRAAKGKDLRLSGAIDIQLAELMDVVCLAMEGGMQFDLALSIYAEGFEGQLAQMLRPAARMLRNGVVEREVIFADMANEIGTVSARRMLDMASRSLRYGTALEPMLRRLSAETRRRCRADREEAVSKAPTKMLIPTGILILPAMMILIMGPFMIEILTQM